MGWNANNYTEIQYDSSFGDTALKIGIGRVDYQCVSCQIIASSYFGTSANFTIQESNNGVNWSDIVDNNGNALTVTITANGVYMLKTSIFYAQYIRLNFLRGDSESGIYDIFTYFKQKNL